ncbi:amidohydrolase family-domain-containing protein [Infundibulicybe gibba]|nr:amidohydrolase family-domain-containing protein [Infundibulicybe gibba]
MEKSSKSPPRTARSNRPSWFLGAFFAVGVFWLFNFYDQYHLYFNRYTLCSSSKNIYTVDESNPRVECVSVTGDRITAVGSRREFTLSCNMIFSSPKINIIVKEESTLLDGINLELSSFTDAHAHIMLGGFMMGLPLAECKSVSEVIDRLKAYILAHPDIRDDRTRWVEGMGWDQTKWPGAKFPTAADLDSDPLLHGRPIVLRRVDSHARWVSLRVLELAGNLPPSIDGGLIVRDQNDKPTGIFIDNAQSLIPFPEWTESQLSDFFDITVKEALAHGVTSIHDAAAGPNDIALFKSKADQGNLPIRIYAMGNVESDEYWGSQIPRLINYGKHQRLNVRSVKLFTDGALGSWGAALLEPYTDKPDTVGLMRSTPEALSNLTKQFWKDGWQVNIHCIGDKANHVILDIFEDILKNGGNVTDWRPRIEHAQIFTPEDLVRIGKLGVIPSVQPTHALAWYLKARKGPKRIRGAYAYRTLLENSPQNVLPLGSDFPVESINPLFGFHAAVSRLSTEGKSPHGDGGWFPEERLTRLQTLKGMTLDPAYASFSEHELGSISPGKKADFVVLNKDIMTISFEDILRTQVSATVVDGKVMYGTL